MTKSKLTTFLSAGMLLVLLLVVGVSYGNAQTTISVQDATMEDDPNADHVSDWNATHDALLAEITDVQEDNTLTTKQKELKTNFYRVLIKTLPHKSINFSLYLAVKRTRKAMENVPEEDMVDLDALINRAQILIQ